MKVLHLTLKKKWFDMIASGEKKEEYRAMSDYWFSRFASCKIEGTKILADFTEYSHIHFYNGAAFSTIYPNFKIEFKGMKTGEGKEEWGAEPGKKYFVISLGEIIK
jgi:hypothetical protein